MLGERDRGKRHVEASIPVQVFAVIRRQVVIQVFIEVVVPVEIVILSGIALGSLENAVSVSAQIGPVIDEQEAVSVGVGIGRGHLREAVVEP
jgi:hypothetical protein